jgi:3-hydroxy-9,10-secoandrosta-1,3,5(10)-triene-9,17-dione monooxygenase
MSPDPLPPPDPTLTPERVIASAAALQPLLREQQEENDRRGYYSEQVHTALMAGGFYRILQPRLFGGYEFGCETFVRAVMEISRGHPASGWCFSLAASHGYILAAHWPEAAQRELFGPHGDFRAAMTASPTGRFERTEGGYRVSGLFAFASGIPVSTHFMGTGILPAAAGPARAVHFVVPRDEFTIEPDWGGEEGMGMQGSGSHSVRLTNAFIPDRYFVPARMMMSSEHLPEGTPGTRLHGNPLYLGVMLGWFSCEFGAILTGAARAAIDEFEVLLRTRKMTFNPQLERMHDPGNQATLGEAMSRADAAEALTLAATRLYVEQCARFAREARPISAADTLRVWSISREACRAACEAVELLFRSAGASVAKRGQRLQRYFRDVQMYRVHIQSQPLFPAMKAQAQLGLPLPPLFN